MGEIGTWLQELGILTGVDRLGNDRKSSPSPPRERSFFSREVGEATEIFHRVFLCPPVSTQRTVFRRLQGLKHLGQ